MGSPRRRLFGRMIEAKENVLDGPDLMVILYVFRDSLER
jgi:hypothetical protein